MKVVMKYNCKVVKDYVARVETEAVSEEDMKLNQNHPRLVVKIHYQITDQTNRQ